MTVTGQLLRLKRLTEDTLGWVDAALSGAPLPPDVELTFTGPDIPEDLRDTFTAGAAAVVEALEAEGYVLTGPEGRALRKALTVLVPFVIWNERDRLAALADKAGAIFDPTGLGCEHRPFSTLIKELHT
jgi:hypothetical protein